MDRKTNAFWATLTALIVIGAVVLCFIGSTDRLLFARPAIRRTPLQDFSMH